MSGILKKPPPKIAAPATNGQDPFWPDTKRLIETGAVTPIISNLVTASLFGVDPSVLSQSWAELYVNSPLPPEDNRDVARVAQYLAVHKNDPVEAKRQYLEALKGFMVGRDDADPELVEEYDEAKRAGISFSELARLFNYPRFPDPSQNPLRLLAELPLPIYLTTGHHQFLQHELVKVSTEKGPRQPVTEIFYWHDGLKRIPSIFSKEPNYVPSVERPMVYHLFGLDDYPESLVLTEDDFLDYLVKLSSIKYEVQHLEKELDLPACVSMALTGTALLLLGYEVYDWDFRVLFKGLVQATGESRFKRTPKSVSMQITPQVDDDAAKRAEIKTYLIQFFEQSHFSVFWGDMAACVSEVYKRWKGS